MFRSPLGRNLAARTRAARRLFLVLGLFAVAACLPFINAGASQQEEVQTRKSPVAAKGQANIVEGAEFVPGEVLVRFRTDAAAKSAEVSPMSLQRAVDGGQVTFQRFSGSDMVRGLRLAKVEAARTLEAVAELASRSDVLYAEPNYIWRATRTPNDPRFADQYGLTRINAPTAWNTTIGSRNIVVGVLDGGVNIAHEDLRDNIWTNPGEVPNNNFDDDGNGKIDDVNGWDFEHDDKTVYDAEDGDDHATHVAGTIGAEGDNALGVTGVNWEVSIMSLKVLGPDGGSVSNIIDGYQYALQMRQRGVNLRVLNNSYGGPGKSQAALDAIVQLNNAGILFVAAAGNGGGDGVGDDNFSFPDFPSNYNVANVIAVASTNNADGLSSFSNFSSRLVSIGAPGSSILSTVPSFVNASGYEFFGGTSMASPHVAGAAALVLSVKPDLPLANLRGVLAFTGDRIAALDGKTTTGRRLNVANALAAAQENDTDSPGFMLDFRVLSQTGRSVTLSWSAPPENLNAGSGTCADYDFFYREGNFGVALPATIQPAAPGTQQTVTLNVPYNHFNGAIEIRAYDNVGNSNGSSTNVTVPVNTGSAPYVVGQSAAQALTAPTSSSIVSGDDKYAFQSLPFAFPFYGVNRTNVTVSTNGVLYFSTPPRRDNGDADDVPSTIESLQGQTMIAGLWDDIDINTALRADSGVFVTQPGGGRILFRWRGVTFSTPRGNVDFEIELRNDGTIITRYGENTNIYPVVGISGGEPSAYVIDSHTRDRTLQIPTPPPLSLTNAPTVTFAARIPTFTVSGRVTENGVGLGGVTMTLSGSLSATTTTDSGGNYSFANLTSGGSYGFTPAKAGYNFTPVGFSLFNLASDAIVNFTAALNNPAGPNSVGAGELSVRGRRRARHLHRHAHGRHVRPGDGRLPHDR
jgi:subtilisin family serine protease